MKRKFKSVNFNEQANEVFPIDYAGPAEPSTWNSFDDLADMKHASIQQALAIRQEHAHSLMFLHNNPDHSTNDTNSTYSNTLLDVYVQCRTNADGPCAQTRHRLAVWHANAPTRRGLEFQSVQTVRMERYKQRLRARQAIMMLQEELFLQARLGGDDLKLPEPMELLRQASEAVSAPSKAFARALADADALSLDDSLALSSANDECSRIANKLVQDCHDYEGLAMMLLKAQKQMPVLSTNSTTTLPIAISYPAAS